MGDFDIRTDELTAIKAVIHRLRPDLDEIDWARYGPGLEIIVALASHRTQSPYRRAKNLIDAADIRMVRTRDHRIHTPDADMPDPFALSAGSRR